MFDKWKLKWKRFQNRKKNLKPKEVIGEWREIRPELVWSYNEKQLVKWLKSNVMNREDGKITQKIIIEVNSPIVLSGVEIIRIPITNEIKLKKKGKNEES